MNSPSCPFQGVRLLKSSFYLPSLPTLTTLSVVAILHPAAWYACAHTHSASRAAAANLTGRVTVSVFVDTGEIVPREQP